MRNGIMLLAMLLLAAGGAAADTLQLSFNERSAQLGYRYHLMEDDYGRSVLEGRLLYNEKEETRLASFGFDFVGEPGNVPGLDLGVGVRLYGGRTEHRHDLLVLAVGGSADFFPPTLGGFGVFGEFFYGPKIFSWLDAERLLEAGIGIGYAVTPRARVHLGYQNIRTNFERTGTWTIDEAVRVGFTASF